MKRQKIQEQIMKLKAEIDFIPFKKREYEINNKVKTDKLKNDETDKVDFELKSNKFPEEKIKELNNTLNEKVKELDIQLENDISLNNKILDDELLVLKRQLRQLEEQLNQLPEIELPDYLDIKEY